ncbi:hypothetical protein [Streptomyces sp. KL116D]|uniref:SpnB-like Rossmann fold domain-containing protein n=1 Tax=Streptomyces sp. KL116D TaxID=3045152 RepID=UPI003558C468
MAGAGDVPDVPRCRRAEPPPAAAVDATRRRRRPVRRLTPGRRHDERVPRPARVRHEYVRHGNREQPREPAASAAWGFLRTAQTENPGRFTLVDTDGRPGSRGPASLRPPRPGRPSSRIRSGSVTTPTHPRPGSPGPHAGRPARPRHRDRS